MFPISIRFAESVINSPRSNLKKILFCVTNDLSHDQRMQRICSTLSAEGYEVTLLGRKKKNSATFASEQYQTKRLHLVFEKGKLFYLEYHIRLFFFLLFNTFDVVCACDIDTSLPVWAASKVKGNKIVFDAHEIFPEVPEVSDRKYIKKIWEAVEKFTVRRFLYRYTVSNSCVKYFRENYHTSFELIRNFPTLKITNSSASKEFTFIYQGAVNKGRGLREFISVLKDYPTSTLLICGDGDELEKLKDFVQTNELLSQVTFKGFVPPAELDNWTSKALFGLNLLSPDSLNYKYSLANKFFDYIQAELPQLTMNFLEYKSFNEEIETTILINDLSSFEIKSGIERCLKWKQNEVVVANLKRAKAVWNWQNEEKKLIAFFSKL